jgi:hypothetical protein
MTKNIKPSTLRTNGSVLILSVPVGITREHDLKPGDQVYWMSEPDGIKLKLLRLSDVAAKIELPVTSPVASK